MQHGRAALANIALPAKGKGRALHSWLSCSGRWRAFDCICSITYCLRMVHLRRASITRAIHNEGGHA
jgi:hypothetical protein